MSWWLRNPFGSNVRRFGATIRRRGSFLEHFESLPVALLGLMGARLWFWTPIGVSSSSPGLSRRPLGSLFGWLRAVLEVSGVAS